MVRDLLLLLSVICFGTMALGQESGSVSPAASDCEVVFMGNVDAYDFKPVVEELQIAARVCDEVTLIVESGGGSVDVGWFYLEDLEEINLHTHIRMNAGSMAVPLYLAGDRRTIDGRGTVFLHNILQPFAEGYQDADNLRQIVAELEVEDDLYAAYVAKRTGLTVINVLELMQADTTLTAVDAVKFGFASTIVNPIP